VQKNRSVKHVNFSLFARSHVRLVLTNISSSLIQPKKTIRELLTDLNEPIFEKLNTSVKERQQQQQYEREAYTSFVELL